MDIATDDPSVIKDVSQNFSHYEIIANSSAASITANKNNRYSSEEHRNLMTDFYNLVYADFMVCTLTSNLCRLVYKLRLVSKPLVTDLHDVISLDEDHFEHFGRDGITHNYYKIRIVSLIDVFSRENL